jgi:hypothetical protein
LAAEKVAFRECVFTPLVTLWAFLSQVLSPDHSCREAVDRLIAYLVARGKPACPPETDTYCKARKRLPIGVIRRLVRRTASDLDDRAPGPWLWKGRRVLLVDGSTVSMPDTPDNQRAYPQARTQAPGVGFPIARVVALIGLATGAVRDVAIGPYKGKDTGETALFRSLWERLGRDEVVLGDRYFSSYFGIAPLVQRGVDGLFRMHQLRHFDFRRGRRLGVESNEGSMGSFACTNSATSISGGADAWGSRTTSCAGPSRHGRGGWTRRPTGNSPANWRSESCASGSAGRASGSMGWCW